MKEAVMEARKRPVHKTTTKMKRASDIERVPIYRMQEVSSVPITDGPGDVLEAEVLGRIASYVGDLGTAGVAVTDAFAFDYGECRVRVQLGDAVREDV